LSGMKGSLKVEGAIAWECGRFGAHCAGAFIRVRTIQVGVVALGSPMSIQPERCVMIIGASSDCLVTRCALLRVVSCEVVAEFVIAFVLSRFSTTPNPSG
jgi:hypothetical protein